MPEQYLIVGCGYLGQRVARRWLAEGLEVAAVTRRAERAGELAVRGIRPFVADVTDAASLRNLPPPDVVLLAAGFDRNAGRSIEEVYVGGLENLLAALPAPPRKFIYISSTGVHGQSDGGWVDESSPCAPTRAGGAAHLAAEQRLAASPVASVSVVLRCAGLYGPGRIPRLDDVTQQQPIAANPDAYLNLIHIDDAAQAVCQAANPAIRSPQSANPTLYLVSDGHPVVRRDFYDELARLLGLPPPPFAAPHETVGRRAGLDNKRIDNRRLVEQLGVRFAYPTYREGLAAIVAGRH